MKGLALIHNSHKTAWTFHKLFAKKEIDLQVMEMQEFNNLLKDETIKQPLSQTWDFVLLLYPVAYDYFNLFEFLEADGIRVFNTPSAVEKCDNKWLTYTTLQEANIPQMRTYETYKQAKENGLLDTDEDGNKLLKKVVVKDRFGSFGDTVHLCSYLSDVKQVVKDLSYENKPFILQEFCETTKNRGGRITCIGGKFVASYYKETKDGDFRVNLQKGAIGIKWQPTKAFIEIAEKTAQTLGCDYCGIDFMFGEFDTPVVCEVNARAVFSAMEEINEMNIKGMYVDYIIGEVMEGDLL